MKHDDPFLEAADAISLPDEPQSVKPPARSRLPLYLIGAGFLAMIAAEIWVRLL